MKTLLFFILILSFNQLTYAQQNTPFYGFHGKWVKDNYGVQIDFDKIVILDKKDSWELSAKSSDTYSFVGKPIVNEQTIFETWVENSMLTNVASIKDSKTYNQQTKQYRIFKIVLKKNGKIELNISNTIREYQNDPGNYWIETPKDLQFPTKFILKKYVPK